MTDQNFILHAYKFDGHGGAQELEGEAITDLLKDKALAWVHLDATHPKTRPWLQQNISYLDNIILNALLASETRPRIMEVNDGTLMILRGVNLNENADPEDMVSIRVWVDAHRIITLQRRQLKAVHDIHERLMEGSGPQNAGDFIVQLTARLFERMEPIMTELDERVDDIEEKIIDDPEPDEREEIINIRKRAIVFRRYIAPQKDVMTHLRLSEQPWLDVSQKRHMQESLDRVTRYVEDLDSIRERAQIVKDELSNALSDRLNKNLYILSVISAIFLPLGFFTGLMGINIGGMPGVDNSNAFWIFSGILVVMVAIQISIFKLLKWF
ncbi:MAG TPA: zinc transporter ZntB [Alphaproteobacteria bacterium]|nr:zinc transporter ZntB [Alphaproteobacteria bacterium]